MTSSLELKYILEKAFLPTRCVCKAYVGGTLVIQLFDPVTQHVSLTVTGIIAENLTSSQAIAQLIADIKDEIIICAELSTKLYHRPS